MGYADFAAISTEEALGELKTSVRGLSDAAAASIMGKSGPNSLPRPRRGGWKVFSRQARSPMNYVLGAAFVISFAVSDWTSGFTVLAFLTLNAVLGFMQEYRSERIVAKLEKFIAPTALVMRAGEWKRVSRERVVPGDVISVEPGDSFPADARIIRSDGLTVDESMLTGESVPAAKSEARLASAPASCASASDIAFAGTIVASGEAEAVVFATRSESVV